MKDFESIFKTATGHSAFPYQTRLAKCNDLPQILEVPTGLGKTAAVVLSWYYRRRHASNEVCRSTPRRLVIVLPTRTLVEQTGEAIVEWFNKLGVLGVTTRPSGDDKCRPLDYEPAREQADKTSPVHHSNISVYTLMGGDLDDGWDLWPEDDAVIIGTQDMILSRALNRGYGMGKFRWPIHYSFLNNDVMWVLDEVQLMGVGLETSCQLDGFHKKLGTVGPTHMLWMSATMVPDRISTVDHPTPDGGWSRICIEQDDMADPEVIKRVGAKKVLNRCPVALDGDKRYSRNVAKRLMEIHTPGTLTLCIVNSVPRAQAIFQELIKAGRTKDNAVVLHARFKVDDRKARMNTLLNASDCIAVTTQVLEAGVDISAKQMITELASWNSMVQRIGRCNRRGEWAEASVEYIDIVSSTDDLYGPYSRGEAEEARALLSTLQDAGPSSLASVLSPLHEQVAMVLRKKDVLDLFDTTPDLLGNDLDVSRFIRDGEDTDVHLYWRDLREQPGDDETTPSKEELCPIPIGAAQGFLKDQIGWTWDHIGGGWVRVGHGSRTRVRPGELILLNISSGGYSPLVGWTGNEKDRPEISTPSHASLPESSIIDRSSGGHWVTLTEHLVDVEKEVRNLVESIPIGREWSEVLSTAARWHDVGKAHAAFQDAISMGAPSNSLWGKSPNAGKVQHPYQMRVGNVEQRRKFFRHELASALAWSKLHPEWPNSDLIAYLIAAHHGKVRLSIRSVPSENRPADGRLFARGIWDGDILPAVEGILPQAMAIELDMMRMGEGSWASRMLRLRDDPNIGPFRLAYLESLLRIGDWRASTKEEIRHDRDQ